MWHQGRNLFSMIALCCLFSIYWHVLCVHAWCISNLMTSTWYVFYLRSTAGNAVDIWHYANLWDTAAWWIREGDSDILWSCEHWQWSQRHLWRWWWPVVWDSVERRSVACQLQVWLPGYWLQENSKQQLLFSPLSVMQLNIGMQDSSFTLLLSSV